MLGLSIFSFCRKLICLFLGSSFRILDLNLFCDLSLFDYLLRFLGSSLCLCQKILSLNKRLLS